LVLLIEKQHKGL